MAIQDNINTIYSFLKDKGLSATDIAAIMGNMQIESGFNPSDWNQGENAIGLAQWELGRRTALDQFAAKAGKPETDLLTQLEYLWQEANQRGNVAGLKQQGDVTSATRYWDQSFEVSAGTTEAGRQAAAAHILSEIQSGSGIKTVPVSGGSVTPAAPFNAKTLTAPVSDPMFQKIAKWLSDGIHTPGIVATQRYTVTRTKNMASGPSTRFNPAPAPLERWTYTITNNTDKQATPVVMHNDVDFIATVLALASGSAIQGDAPGSVLHPGILPNPLTGIADAISAVGDFLSPIGKFFEALAWIFSVDHFFKFMLYLLGFWAIAIGLGVITFGAGKTSEDEG